MVPIFHIASVYALLEEMPGAKRIASVNLTYAKNLLSSASRGHYGREKAIAIQNAAKAYIGSQMPSKCLELQYTIRLIQELGRENAGIEDEIQKIMNDLDSPVATISSVGPHMWTMILAEIGDFSNFDSLDKILVYDGLYPSTYQSGQLQNCIHTWGNEAHSICATPCLMMPNTLVLGTPHSSLTWRKRTGEASTTSLLLSTLLRSCLF